jgi:hypothetical protein
MELFRQQRCEVTLSDSVSRHYLRKSQNQAFELPLDFNSLGRIKVEFLDLIKLSWHRISISPTPPAKIVEQIDGRLVKILCAVIPPNPPCGRYCCVSPIFPHIVVVEGPFVVDLHRES